MRQNPGATEFSILFNPTKHNTFGLSRVFFKDKTQLKAAIEIGACYSLL
jgi:hypothetical protein